MGCLRPVRSWTRSGPELRPRVGASLVVPAGRPQWDGPRCAGVLRTFLSLRPLPRIGLQSLTILSIGNTGPHVHLQPHLRLWVSGLMAPGPCGRGVLPFLPCVWCIPSAWCLRPSALLAAVMPGCKRLRGQSQRTRMVGSQGDSRPDMVQDPAGCAPWPQASRPLIQRPAAVSGGLGSSCPHLHPSRGGPASQGRQAGGTLTRLRLPQRDAELLGRLGSVSWALAAPGRGTRALYSSPPSLLAICEALLRPGPASSGPPMPGSRLLGPISP